MQHASIEKGKMVAMKHASIEKGKMVAMYLLNKWVWSVTEEFG